jgi:hypothetical protein
MLGIKYARSTEKIDDNKKKIRKEKSKRNYKKM